MEITGEGRAGLLLKKTVYTQWHHSKNKVHLRLNFLGENAPRPP